MHYNSITPLPLYAPAENVEGYTQEVLARWLVFYFSGNSFQFYHGDALLTKTLPHCDVGFAESEIPDPMERPYIHCYHLSATDEKYAKAPHDAEYFSRHRMMIDVMVPSTLSKVAALPGARAEHHCRAVADALYWLLQTQERGALVAAGIRRVRAIRRPVINAAPPGYYKRSFLIGYEFTYQVQ